MILPITKKYIITKNVLIGFRKEHPLRIVVENISHKRDAVKNITSNELKSDFGFLPLVTNKYSERNAECWFTIDKTKPKEIYSYDLWCLRYRWAGRGKSEPRYEWLSFNKERYHRDYHSPYEIYFYYSMQEDRIFSDPIIFNDKNFPIIKNTINLILKQFGECVVDDCDNNYVGRVEIVKWKFLPSGSWSKDREVIENNFKKGKKSEIQNFIHDLEILYSFSPDKVAVGEGGFNGYVAFCYINKKLCVLESQHPLNATYVFNIDFWQELSKRTKTDIIESKSALKRIYHKKTWEKEISEILK